MIAIHPLYITDTDGNRLSVVLPMSEFEKIMELLEDYEDEQLYELAKQVDEPGLPIDEALQIIEENRKKSPKNNNA